MLYQGKPKEAREAWRVKRGEKALDFLESALAGRNWLAASTITIADMRSSPMRGWHTKAVSSF
jgi:glutathione S-transferase